MRRHLSTKTYGHEIGLSTCFRQWRAESHCRFLHGYAIAVRLEFGSHQLNECNWVMDFGAMKPIKKFLEDTFDHKLVIAEDDPHRGHLESSLLGIAKTVILPHVGCEYFAQHIFEFVEEWLGHSDVWIEQVEVKEHGANSAIYTRRNV